MKKLIFIIMFLIFLLVIILVFFNNKKDALLAKEEALLIGEEKYLQFLWMVDGAFNNERLNEEFLVNNKKIMDKDKVFTCVYKTKKSKECAGNNFDSEFKKLFKSSINYEKVYSDGMVYSWITFNNGQYIFNNLDTCNINRMGLNHTLKVISFNNKKIIYEVLFDNRGTMRQIKRDFSLELEDNEWKISSAFYYDLCGMRYSIY